MDPMGVACKCGELPVNAMNYPDRRQDGLEWLVMRICPIMISLLPIGSMYAIYGHMDPINMPPMLAYIPAPWILWVMLGGIQVMVECLCRMVLPISAEAEVLLLKSVKGGGSGAPLDLGREVLGVLKALRFADAEAAWDLGCGVPGVGI